MLQQDSSLRQLLYLLVIKCKISSWCDWLPHDVVFYFEIYYKVNLNKYLGNNYHEIFSSALRNEVLFIYPPMLLNQRTSFHQSLQLFPISANNNRGSGLDAWNSLVKILVRSPTDIYERIEGDLFDFNAIEPAYFFRRYDESTVVLWPYTTFVTKNSIQLSKDYFLPNGKFLRSVT